MSRARTASDVPTDENASPTGDTDETLAPGSGGGNSDKPSGGSITATARDVEIPETDRQRLFLLAVGDGVYASQALPLHGQVVIGRASDVDVRIDDPSISRQHAVLHLASRLKIEDAGSANGTWVREQRLEPGQPVDIRLNEALQLGSVTVIVQRRPAQVRTRRLRSHDYFESRVEDECARALRSGSQFVIVHLRMDGAVDTDLQPVLTIGLREADIVAAYAPGELEVLLVDTEPATADSVIRRLTAAVGARRLTAHIGTAWYPGDGRDASTLGACARDRARGKPRDAEPSAIVVADDRMRQLHALVGRVAAADISVLLLGETGVGKEIVAEMIHRGSSRSRKPFLRLNCSALTETLLESELFGHERGSFTGAVQSKPGLLEVAEGGVVFLDEIGEMRASTQAKLLRVLDERKVLRVGGLKPRPIDVRVVSATNRDLDLEVRRGNFRLDLLYRLNAMSIVIPPLRERTSEIEPLARHFLRTISASIGRSPPPVLAPDAIELFLEYSWPGNVRELRNVIERALILCAGDEIRARDLPEEKMRSTFTTGISTADLSGEHRAVEPGPGISSERTPPPVLVGGVDRGERQRIIDALEECAGNQTYAARMLGISRRTLINRLEKYDVPRPRKRIK